MLRLKYKKKGVYILYIKKMSINENNVINEEDIITFDRWEDMSLSKLRYVIKISYKNML